MSDQAHFEVFPDSEGMYRWRLKAANGEIVAQSEAYKTAEHTQRAVVVVASWTTPATSRTVFSVRVEQVST